MKDHFTVTVDPVLNVLYNPIKHSPEKLNSKIPGERQKFQWIMTYILVLNIVSLQKPWNIMYNSCWTTFMALSCYFSSFRATGQHSLPLFGVTWGWVDDLSAELPYFNLERSTQAKGTVCLSSSFVSSWGQAWNTLLNQPYRWGNHQTHSPDASLGV